MARYQVPPGAQPFIQQLRRLIAPGVSAAQLPASSELLTLPFITELSRSEGLPPIAALSTAIRAVSLEDNARPGTAAVLQGREREMARVLFAVGEYAGIAASNRRRAAARIYYEGGEGRPYTDAEWNRVATRKWDSFSKGPLDRLLVAVLTALTSSRKSSEQTRVGPAAARVTGEDPYRIALYDVHYNFPRVAGQPRLILETRVIVPNSPLSSWRQTFRYWGKNPDEPPQVTLFGLGTLTISDDAPYALGDEEGRAFAMNITYEKPLPEGEEFRFALLHRHAVDFQRLTRTGWRDQRDLVPAKTVDEARISVRFPPDRTPGVVWVYAGMADWLAPGEPVEGSVRAPDGSGFVTETWRTLEKGLAYGIAWRW